MDYAEALRQRGIQPSAQRVAIAQYVLATEEHPSAERIFAKVRARFPMVSRATVYNTLNLFVRKGLLRELALTEGNVVFDPNVERHHHFIDEATGRIYDLPWDSVRISKLETPDGYDVREYQVVLRGRRAPRR